MNYKSKEAVIPLRRSELITPNGVGALNTNIDGINMMTGALDIWFKQVDDISEFVIEEERLRHLLNVQELRLPPDYRENYDKYNKNANEKLTIPFVRFPNYYYCSSCRVLTRKNGFEKDSKITCTSCNNKFAKLIQVPLVVACENGHIDDFPWREWLHGELECECEGDLVLKSTGGATLSTMKVACNKCHKEKSLRGLTTNGAEILSQTLGKESIYTCSGRKPWFGEAIEKEECNCKPQPILKNSNNAYYPQVLNAIYLPIIAFQDIERILAFFNSKHIREIIESFTEYKMSDEIIVTEVKRRHSSQLSKYSDELMLKALSIYKENQVLKRKKVYNLKLEEYVYLSRNELLDEKDLKVVPEYNYFNGDESLRKYGLSKVNLIPKLIETRVLYGFNRLVAPVNLAHNPEKMIKEGKRNLFINPEQHSWLPAYQVYGEGIFIELREDLILEWIEKYRHSKRFQQAEKRLNNAKANGIEVSEKVDIKFILIHTLAHLFIQEVVISSGYSSSSLKERIYCGENNGKQMSGFLIYTAAGDSEGTMGGLVRLGKKENIDRILNKIIQSAMWCSSDPVCNEAGMSRGQGRDYLNGAACHNCAYISEISCEEFNKYLDRGMISIYEQDQEYKSFFEYVKTK
ncbi:DrmB family protein [Metalysinibacillus jejuensis]|uniref:DrmB family protein n=1 Tax=Metalysinibacillus jejuensis TaxID=914327 RepID=UPI00137B84FD|nr:DrmB family protein [Metalysinibacillus jejuensis]